MNTKKLSRLQKTILKHLRDSNFESSMYSLSHKVAKDTSGDNIYWAYGGHRFHLVRMEFLTNSFLASFCRSVKRLEKRGLVERIKGEWKTTRVKLTHEGREYVEEMMNDECK